MKKYVAIFLILIAALAAPAIIFFPSYEFFLWTSAGFDRNYRKINKCLDVEKGCWDYKAKVCRRALAGGALAGGALAGHDEPNAQVLCEQSRVK